MKPGYQTTEFWLSLMAVLVGAVLSSGLLGEGTTVFRVLAVAAAALSALGYTGARTLLKMSAQRSRGRTS